MFKLILGYLLIILGTLDGIKYYWFGQKIEKTKSSNAYSRKGLNVAIFNDFIRIIYGIVIMDNYIVVSSILASITMIFCWYKIYQYYPYRKRGLINFRRPSIMKYLINSILPNKIRKHL